MANTDSFPTFDRSKHLITSLTKNLKIVDPHRMGKELQQKGWCFLEFPENIFELEKLTNQLSTFFSSPQNIKENYSGPYGFGYSSVSHKESLRVLTGLRMKKFQERNLMPKDLHDSLQPIVKKLDELSLFIALSLCKFIFEKDASLMAREADIPVAFGRHFGMLDAAFYFNNQTTSLPPPSIGSSVDEVNCVPHFDPGLLSISFWSNNEGLQLLDPTTNEWVAGPVNTTEGQERIAIIWLGEAAVKVGENLKAGIHRVIYPRVAKPRLTIWYEMCTVTQSEPPLEEKVDPGQVPVQSMLGATVEVKKGESKMDILNKIERTKGIPPSKVSRIDDRFHRSYFE